VYLQRSVPACACALTSCAPALHSARRQLGRWKLCLALRSQGSILHSGARTQRDTGHSRRQNSSNRWEGRAAIPGPCRQVGPHLMWWAGSASIKRGADGANDGHLQQGTPVGVSAAGVPVRVRIRPSWALQTGLPCCSSCRHSAAQQLSKNEAAVAGWRSVSMTGPRGCCMLTRAPLLL
jgi:hypothetical protein